MCSPLWRTTLQHLWLSLGNAQATKGRASACWTRSPPPTIPRSLLIDPWTLLPRSGLALQWRSPMSRCRFLYLNQGMSYFSLWRYATKCSVQSVKRAPRRSIKNHARTSLLELSRDYCELSVRWCVYFALIALSFLAGCGTPSELSMSCSAGDVDDDSQDAWSGAEILRAVSKASLACYSMQANCRPSVSTAALQTRLSSFGRGFSTREEWCHNGSTRYKCMQGLQLVAYDACGPGCIQHSDGRNAAGNGLQRRRSSPGSTTHRSQSWHSEVCGARVFIQRSSRDTEPSFDADGQPLVARLLTSAPWSLNC